MNCVCKFSPGNQDVGLPDGLRPRFLSGLPKAELEAVLSVAKHRQFRASSVIINQEDPAERFFLLTSGQGRHFVITSEGQKDNSPLVDSRADLRWRHNSLYSVPISCQLGSAGGQLCTRLGEADHPGNNIRLPGTIRQCLVNCGDRKCCVADRSTCLAERR